MKILAGTHKNRPITRPNTRTVRPMGDKVRAALFDIVGSVEGADVLDAYAGSGAVGFEALSRGAAHVTSIEKNPRVANVIRQNAQVLGLTAAHRLIVDEVVHWLKTPKPRVKGQPFDKLRSGGSNVSRFNLIVADPPYEQIDPTVLSQLATHLAPDGVMVVSHSSRIQAPELQSVKLIQSRTYGDAALSFYRTIDI